MRSVSLSSRSLPMLDSEESGERGGVLSDSPPWVLSGGLMLVLLHLQSLLSSLLLSSLLSVSPPLTQSTSNDIAKTVNSCPALADKTALEALNIIVSGPAFENQNVVTIGNCIHYLIDTTGVDVPYKTYQEGQLYSGIGASKSVKTLEGTNRNEPSAFITTEMKSTVFHPDNWPLIDLFKTYTGFKPDMKANSFLGQKMERAFVGLQVMLNYGENKDLGEDGMIMEIRRFHTSAMETYFKVDGEDINVYNYFKKKYGKPLDYPNLFTIEVKGKKGKIHLPAELLILCPSQIVTNDQMVNNEQSDMIRISAAKPHLRKSITDTVAKKVGLASNNVYGFIKVEDPIKVEGVLLNKPKIVFAGNKAASLPNPRGVPTDFNRAGNYAIAKELRNWEVVFSKKEEVVNGFVDTLRQEMKDSGMNALAPTITFIGNEDLEAVFKKAKAANRQLLFFVIPSGYHYHQRIKALEQKYDVLTQEVKAETALKANRQPQTRLNIVNKTNMKLGGLNYEIQTDSFRKPSRVIVGFETSQRSGGNPDYPISVGFAANMLKHHQQFAGGYVYVKRDKDIFGSILTGTLITILKTTNANRSKPDEILIYFNGVSEGQFSLLNETYRKRVEEACAFLHPNYKPHITIIASSKMHNERLYKSDNGIIGNLEPGTVIDHTIVSPVYNEWFHASAVARQGTTKATKYTLIYTTNSAVTMSDLEELTNDLCYDHQIVFQPIGLPVPLYIAGRYSQRGAAVLAENRGPIFKGNEVDLEKTNKEYGYGTKTLFNTRFNA
ncbi:hypothetical protein CAEBREN_03102 [Caenorhabditis brenneri]|uniref:Piwi domain-containing protein n=1 Tax=Caenorhabditis brenneri TaxID=135651 RepID=G0NEF7_CAEBE|nr:hypothetical protein CAEBREN_03102 [Caenorhabditis brenneri]